MLPLFFIYFYISQGHTTFIYTTRRVPFCCPHGEILLQHIQNKVKHVFLMTVKEKHNL
jgi:hypothetical protein